MEILENLKREPVIAYLSMEIALFNDIPTYSGGLGVLAGDTVRSAADLSLPFVAVTLVSRKGYFRQEITPEGWQVEHPMEWDVEKILTPPPPKGHGHHRGPKGHSRSLGVFLAELHRKYCSSHFP